MPLLPTPLTPRQFSPCVRRSPRAIPCIHRRFFFTKIPSVFGSFQVYSTALPVPTVCSAQAAVAAAAAEPELRERLWAHVGRLGELTGATVESHIVAFVVGAPACPCPTRLGPFVRIAAWECSFSAACDVATKMMLLFWRGVPARSQGLRRMRSMRASASYKRGSTYLPFGRPQCLRCAIGSWFNDSSMAAFHVPICVFNSWLKYTRAVRPLFAGDVEVAGGPLRCAHGPRHCRSCCRTRRVRSLEEGCSSSSKWEQC